MKSQKGVALIFLVFIVAILITIAIIGIKYVMEKAEEEKVEDIKSHILSIQALVKKVKNKNIIDEASNPLLGVKLDLGNNTTEYKISQELKDKLLQIEGANLYILTQEDINNNGLKQITVNNEEFYIVDYNSEEVYYSLGINGEYTLIDENNETQENETEEVVENAEQENEGAEDEGTGN